MLTNKKKIYYSDRRGISGLPILFEFLPESAKDRSINTIGKKF